jgi:hypothetical protein
VDLSLNNRELALVVWTGIILLWALSRQDLRGPLFGVIRAVLNPVILVPLLSFGLYIAGWVCLADRVDLWQSELINETIFWFLVSGLVLFGRFSQVYEQEDYFHRAARRALRWGILAEVLINLVVMPFWGEFLFLPFLTFLVLMQVVAQHRDDLGQVEKFLDGALSVIGLGLFGFVALSVVFNPSQFDPAYYLRLLALPIWLSIVSLPFIYLLGLYAAYDKHFRWLRFIAPDEAVAWRARRALVRGFHLRARRLGTFDRAWQRRLVDAAATSPAEASRVVGQFLRTEQGVASA